jgi:hypothetical protein
MDVRKMNLPLPAPLHAAVFGEARQRGIPATRLVREVLAEWLAESARKRQADEIRQFATANAGTREDLDPELEEAAVGLLASEPDDAQG